MNDTKKIIKKNMRRKLKSSNLLKCGPHSLFHSLDFIFVVLSFAHYRCANVDADATRETWHTHTQRLKIKQMQRNHHIKKRLNAILMA